MDGRGNRRVGIIKLLLSLVISVALVSEILPAKVLAEIAAEQDDSGFPSITVDAGDPEVILVPEEDGACEVNQDEEADLSGKAAGIVDVANDAQLISAQLDSGYCIRNISENPVAWNAGSNPSGNLPAAAATVYVGEQYYLNMQVTDNVKVSKAVLTITPPNASSYQYSFSINNYIRWANYPCSFSSAGTLTYTWYLEYVGGGSNTFTNSATVSKHKSTLNVSDYIGFYDGVGHTIGCSVSGPSSCSLYYSTSTELNASNYSSAGTTNKPSFSKTGYYEVHVFLVDHSGKYDSASATAYVYIKPRITTSDFSGTYDGKAHSPTINCSGSKLYYRTSEPFPNDIKTILLANKLRLGTTDAQSAGLSETLPSRTDAGVLTVYYIAVPSGVPYMGSRLNANDTEHDVLVVGSATVNIARASVVGANVQVTNQTYTGSPLTPVPAVTMGGRTLANGIDYTLSYKNNTAVGTATVIVTGKGNYSGSGNVSATFTISPKSLSSCTATLSQSSYTYDGTQKNPTVTVKDGSKMLVYGTDYALTIPSGRTDAGTYTYTVTGKSNYTGSTTAVFTIAAANLSGAAIASIPDQAYTGSAVKPTPAVTMGGKTLKSGTDYTLSYKYNTAVGTATVTATGKGNYTGTKSATFRIVASSTESTITLSKTSFTYNGSAQRPTVTVKAGSATLASGTDYDLAWSPSGCTNAGTYTVTATLKGNYSGNVSATFTISPKSLSSCTVTLSQSSYTYDGTQKNPTVTVKDGSKVLAAGTDYTLTTPSGRTDVGTYTYTVTGKSNYAGTKSASFSIVAASIAGASVASIADQAYTGSAIKPTPKVTLGGRTLISGTDYTLSYKDNTAVGTATVTATGRGNYTGTKSATFKIIASATKPAITLSKTSFTYNGFDQRPAVTLKVGTITIQENTDYTLSWPSSGCINAGTYTVKATLKGNYSGTISATFTISPKSLSSCTVTVSPASYTYDGTQKNPTVTVKDGSKVLAADTDYTLTTPSGRTDAGTYTYTVTGKGNYTGTKTASFTIAAANLSEATIASIPDQSYTGFAVKPTPAITMNGKVIKSGTDYTLSYKNNTAVGTATVTVTGRGNYTGTKSATFKIVQTAKALTLSDLTYSFGNSYEDFGYPDGYYIPLISYQLVFGNIQGQVYYSRDRSKGVTWGGNCYGMAASSAMFNVGGSGFQRSAFRASANANSYLRTSDVWDGNSLTRYVEAMQVSQKDPSKGSVQWANDSDNIGVTTALSKLVNAIKDSSATGRLPMVTYGWQNSDGSYNGHAVVGIGVQTENATTDRLLIYDPNFPQKARYIRLSKNSAGKYTGWYYKHNEGYRNWRDTGSSYAENYISYVPYDVYEGIWKNGRRNSSMNTLLTSSHNFSLSDAEGNVVAEVNNGNISSSQGIIVDKPSEEHTGNDYDTVLYVPSDVVYTLKAFDTGGVQLDATMVDTHQSASIVTDASEVTFAVNDAEEVNLVDVEAGAGESYCVTLNSELKSAKGQESIELSGMGNGQRTSVGTVSGSCVIVNGRTASLTVNGESVDIGSRIGITPKEVSLEYAECVYDGKAKEPKVSVTHNGMSLVEERDFVVKYSNNVEPGNADVAVYGIGDYDGKVDLTFAIKAVQTITASNKTVAVGKAVSLAAKTTGDGKLTYKSSDTKVATVSAKGVVTGVSAGTAKVTVTAAETANWKKATKTVTVTVTQPALSFTDVTAKTAHCDDIKWLAAQGISKGWDMPDGTVQFRPYANIARADMAAFLFRLARSWGAVSDSWQPTAAQKKAFSDVTDKTPHAREIWWLASAGISNGTKVGSVYEFRPYENVIRRDMAAFLFRLAKLQGRGGASDSWAATASQKATFRDVTSSTIHATSIWWLASSGVSEGWTVNGGREFRPASPVARADMAAFLHRLDGLS